LSSAQIISNLTADQLLAQMMVSGVAQEIIFASTIATIAASQSAPIGVLGATTNLYNVPAGYIALVVSVNCGQNANVALYVKIRQKQMFNNGLLSTAIGSIGITNTAPQEVPVYQPANPTDQIDLQVTNSSASPISNFPYFIRIRLYMQPTPVATLVPAVVPIAQAPPSGKFLVPAGMVGR
jgi:hypothetical protein